MNPEAISNMRAHTLSRLGELLTQIGYVMTLVDSAVLGQQAGVMQAYVVQLAKAMQNAVDHTNHILKIFAKMPPVALNMYALSDALEVARKKVKRVGYNVQNEKSVDTIKEQAYSALFILQREIERVRDAILNAQAADKAAAAGAVETQLKAEVQAVLGRYASAVELVQVSQSVVEICVTFKTVQEPSPLVASRVYIRGAVTYAEVGGTEYRVSLPSVFDKVTTDELVVGYIIGKDKGALLSVVAKGAAAHAMLRHHKAQVAAHRQNSPKEAHRGALVAQWQTALREKGYTVMVDTFHMNNERTVLLTVRA